MPATATTMTIGDREVFMRVAEYVRMSTDHQRYSIANQSALIHAYAQAHRMQIVQAYADPGRSGLTLRDRPGLSRLLADIAGGAVQFEAVLVYDISRWGRFQDADESAHYEFLCRRAGIRVIYCAEQFAADGTPFAGVLKALKRAMAGEYSRELGVKVAAGKARIGQLGFRVGGGAGYGLRRQVMEDGKIPGQVLHEHQRKGVMSDRVRLVPGPADEIAIVRRIYRDYIHLRKSERDIAADLNAEGLTWSGRPWSRNHVRTVLGNEKYIGNNIVGQYSQRLRTPQVIRPREEWTRCNGAFAAVVTHDLFEAASRVRKFNEKRYVTREQILAAAARVLKREGRLTAAVINRAPELPSANTVEARFGSLVELYEGLGWRPAARYEHHAVNRRLRVLRMETEMALLRALEDLGFSPTIERGLIRAGGTTAEVVVCRHQAPRTWQQGWRMVYQRSRGGAVLVAVRMSPDNLLVQDVLVVPRVALAALPLFIQAKHERQVAAYQCATPAAAASALIRGAGCPS